MDTANRWPPNKKMSPTSLKSYRNCPYRIRLQYIDRVPQPEVFNIFFAKGNAAHLALREVAESRRYNRPRVPDSRVENIARLHLPEREYETVSADMRNADIQQVMNWVAFGRAYIEAIPEPEWLLIEDFLERDWPLFHGENAHRYGMISKPDLIIRRHDEEDGPLIEFIDYKTGKIRPEDDPPVIQRFVARDLLQHFTAGQASDARVRFTYLWLDHRDWTHIDLTIEHCADRWSSIEQQMRDLVTETEWPPKPSFLCNYCPYKDGICPHSAADETRTPFDDEY